MFACLSSHAHSYWSPGPAGSGVNQTPMMRAESELVWPLPRSILNLARKNRDLVGLGSYIINAQAGCNDCHSCPSDAAGGNPYLRQPKQFNGENYLAGGVPFGPFTSRNLTPEQNRLADGLTFDQFKLML